MTSRLYLFRGHDTASNAYRVVDEGHKQLFDGRPFEQRSLAGLTDFPLDDLPLRRCISGLVHSLTIAGHPMTFQFTPAQLEETSVRDRLRWCFGASRLWRRAPERDSQVGDTHQ